jgi:hypothetical protein
MYNPFSKKVDIRSRVIAVLNARLKKAQHEYDAEHKAKTEAHKREALELASKQDGELLELAEKHVTSVLGKVM